MNSAHIDLCRHRPSCLQIRDNLTGGLMALLGANQPDPFEPFAVWFDGLGKHVTLVPNQLTRMRKTAFPRTPRKTAPQRNGTIDRGEKNSCKMRAYSERFTI